MEIVALFPGQGSQKPGMGRDLAERFPEAKRVFDEVDDALSTPLSTLCFEGPADELTRTHNAQPALLAHGIAVWRVIAGRTGQRARAGAGHSLGEFTAHCAAGAMSLGAAVKLVRRRGQLMYEAGEQRPGTMAAVLGDLDRPIDDVCGRASGDAGLVVPANYNAPGQTVISGEVAGVECAMAIARSSGARRTVRLQVSGAFHSPLMDPARPGLEQALAEAGVGEPAFPVYSNVSEEPVTDGARARELLLRQLTAPVRWMGEMRAMAAAFPGALFVEMGPGNVLTGLMKRIAPEVATASCGTAADVETFLQQVA